MKSIVNNRKYSVDKLTEKEYRLIEGGYTMDEHGNTCTDFPRKETIDIMGHKIEL